MYSFDSHAKKRISFILVTKNRAGYLDEALLRYKDLIKKQDELVLIDGASSDDTKKVVEKHKDIVDIFISEPDTSGMHAQNKAILLSCGKYVKLITDDDLFFGEGLEKAISILEKNPEIDLLICGGTKERRGRKKEFSVPLDVDYGNDPLDIVRYGAPGTAHIVRKSVFAKVGLIAPVINADMEFAMRCIAKGRVVRFFESHLFLHEIFDHSVIVKYRKKHQIETANLIKKYCNFLTYVKYRINLFLGRNPKHYI